MANTVQQRMDELGLTQAELARRMNEVVEEVFGTTGKVSVRTVHNLMYGKTSWPHTKIRIALESVLGRTAEELGFVPRTKARTGDE